MNRFFNKELDLDSHVSQMKPDTVRERLNMRIVSNDDGSYTVESVNGPKILFSINPEYLIIGWREYPGKLILFSTPFASGSATSGNLEIGILTVDETTMVGTYTPLYNHQALAGSPDFNIEADAYEENGEIGRVYWTDRDKPFRALNVNSPIFITYIAAGALVSLPVPNQYMVLTGTVTNAAGTFGPNSAAGTVFTADGTEVYAGALVVDYVPVESLDISTTKTAYDIHFNKWIPGNVQIGGWIYSAQLETGDGGTSTWGYLSQMISLTKETPGSGAAYQNYQGHESIVALAPNLSSKGIQIRVENIDQNFKRIRIAATAITGVNPYGTPIGIGTPRVIKDELITGTVMTFDHIGNEDLLELTLADLNAIRVNLRAVGTVAIVQNFCTVGKVKSNVNYEIRNLSGIVAKNIEYLFPSDRSGYPTGSDIVMAGGVAKANVPSGEIREDAWYKVTNGIVRYDTVDYDSSTSPDGEVFFQGTIGGGQNFTLPAQPGVPTVQAVIRIQKYTGKYKNIPLTDDFYDYKGMAMAAEMQSQWRGETYRWGMLLYDNIGNPLFVQHAKDKTNIEQYHRPADIDPDTGQPWGIEGRLNHSYTNNKVNLRAIGTKFSNIDINDLMTNLGLTNYADLKKYFSGFSMVRVPTDRQAVANGMLFPTSLLANYPVGRPQVCAWTTIKGFADQSWSTNGRKHNYYIFVSADFQFNINGLPNRQSGDYLKALNYYQDIVGDSGGGDNCGFPELGGTFSFRYNKMMDNSYPGFAHLPQGGNTNEILMHRTYEFNEANGVQTFLPDTIYGSSLEFTSSTMNNFGALNRRGIVCRATVIALKADENGGNAKQVDPNLPGQNYPQGFGDYDDATGASPNLMTVNWMRRKGNLYGGTTAAAKSNNEYVLSGHVQAFDDEFLAYLQSTGGIVNDVEVFGGDCFINYYDVCFSVWDDQYVDPDQFQKTYFFFSENAVNTDLREGRHVARNHSIDSTGTGTPQVTNGIDRVSVEQFLYNPAYSYNRNLGVYPAVPLGYRFIAEQRHHGFYAGPKVDGERIDKMKEFLPNNFLQLNGRNGAVVNFRAKNNKLYYFQENSVGYIPINERTTIGGAFGEPTTLGTGGVMARFDELQTYWGNQHQFSLCETEDSFHWFDAKRRSWCIASLSGQVMELSTVKGMQAVLRNLRGRMIPSTTNVFPHYDKPANGIGFHTAFDNAFKEVVLSIKGITDISNVLQPDRMYSWDNKNKQFAGSYSYSPGLMINFANRLISFNRPSNFSTIQASTVYNLRDFVLQNTDIYVCILPFTTGVAPTIPSSDALHWALVGQISNVYVHNEGVKSKFYGVVYPSRIKFVLNHDHFDDKVLDNCKLTGNENFFDDATYETSDQIASDIDISRSVPEEYEYRNKAWYFTIPVPVDGRFTDNYFIVTWERKNSLNPGDIINSDDKLLRIVSAIFDTRKAY